MLPFENTSGDTCFDYLGDGITDHVRDAPNVQPELTVNARGSSRALVGRALGRLAIVYSSAPLVGVTAVDSMLALATSTAQRALALEGRVTEALVQARRGRDYDPLSIEANVV